MSTKKTRQLIEWAKAIAKGIGMASTWNLVQEAREEQQAIERAAKVIGEARVSLHGDNVDELADACDFMESIAKDAP